MAIIEFFRLSGDQNPSSANFDAYQKTYAMWKEIWSATFAELEGSERIFSNDWTRQSIIHAVFSDGVPVASCFHRFVDFRNPAVIDDQYFGPWPEKAIQGLVADGPMIDVCSNFTISASARGEKLGFKLKEVLMGLTVKELQNSDCASMTGTMRVDKGMHHSTYEVGADLLVPNLIFHNVPVDLVAFRKDKVKINHDKPSGMITERLWKESRIDDSLNRTAA